MSMVSVKYLIKFVGNNNAKAECEPKGSIEKEEYFTPSFAGVLSQPKIWTWATHFSTCKNTPQERFKERRENIYKSWNTQIYN